MSFFTHSPFRLGLSRSAGWIGKALLLSTGASLLIAGQAKAVETIQLRYSGSDPNVPSTVNLTLRDIQTFVQSGDLPQQVREFLTVNQQEITPLRNVLTEEIRVPSNVGSDVNEFIDSSVGRFVVSQLEDFIQSSDVATDLRTALRQSIQDDRNISLLEIIENYPTQSVTLNITGLVQAYNDVSAFVDRVLPALEVARQYLQDLICECEQPAAAAPADSTAASSAVKSQLTSTLNSNAPNSNALNSNTPNSNCVPRTVPSAQLPQQVAQPQSTQLP